jgi:hypothetical protein
MTSSARSVAAVVILLAAGALAAPRDASAGAPCQPAARVDGDEEIAGPVRLELAVLGVRTAAIPPPCPAVDVTVSAAGEQVSVALRDPSGRRAGQVVTNARVAATWIESWLHPELRAPLLGPRAGEIAAGRTAPAASRMSYRGLTVGAAAERVYASDDSEWRSLSLAACARLGPLCPGLVTRLADNRDFSPEGVWNRLDRLAVDVTASLSAPFDVGRMQITPGVAVGLGYLRTASDACEDVPSDPSTVCQMYLRSSATIGPRAEMGLAAVFPVAGGVSLVIAGSLGFAPMARSQPTLLTINPDGSAPEPGPDGSIPDDGNDDGNRDDTPMTESAPGEPNHFTRIGVGLAVELD